MINLTLPFKRTLNPCKVHGTYHVSGVLNGADTLQQQPVKKAALPAP